MLSLDTKNTLAKITILLLILGLIALAGYVARFSIGFEVNQYLGLSGLNALPVEVNREIQLMILMLSVSIIGGVSFMIKDFYRSIKYANLYTVAYSDYTSGKIHLSEFQRLVTVEIYTGRFNYTWAYWFFMQPVLSSVLGIVAFFIARSGLGVLQGSGSVTPEITIQSLYLYAVFTFLAGFSSHKFIAWLDRLADKIFSTTLPERLVEQKAQVQQTVSEDISQLRQQVPSSNSSAEEFATEAETGKVVQDMQRAKTIR